MINESKRIEVWKKYNRHCAYCGKIIKYTQMQVDHLHPKILSHFHNKGRDDNGKIILIDPDRIENLMPSCRRCNHYKRANTLEEFRRLMKTIHERLLQIYIAKVAVDYGIIKITQFDGLFYFEKLKRKTK